MPAAKRVLIVDDDASTRSGLTEFLIEKGFECTAVGTLEESRAIMSTSPPDLLITDIRLKAFNGLQLVIGRPHNVQAIVITAYPDSVLEAETARHGALYLQKPVKLDEMAELVRRTLAAGDADPQHRG